MRPFKTTILVVAMVVCAALVSAATDKEVPPWMEKAEVNGRSTYLIPKGAKREIIGSQIIIESPSEFVARRIYEMEQYLEERFKQILETQDSLQKELSKVKEELQALKDSAHSNAVEVQTLKDGFNQADESLTTIRDQE